MRKKKKIKNEPITLIVIPQTAGNPVSMSMSRTKLFALFILLFAIILAMLLIGYSYFASQADIRNVNQLKAENQSKDQIIQSLGQKLDKIEKEQKNIIKKQNDIKKLMGIETESDASLSPSRGGNSTSLREDNKLQLAEYVVSQLKSQEKEIDLLLAQVNKQPQYYRDIPNQWPVIGEISSYYGWRKSPFGRKTSFHDGIDIESNSGTPVLAAADGTVIYSGWQAVYGRTLEIENSSGFITKYGHNSALLVKQGDRIKKGQVICRVGNTGRSTGPHLHFTVFKDKETQDPLKYLPLEDNG